MYSVLIYQWVYLAMVYVKITSKVKVNAGTNKSKQPITVTTIKKKFFELTPVLLPISLAKYDFFFLDIFEI